MFSDISKPGWLARIPIIALATVVVAVTVWAFGVGHSKAASEAVPGPEGIALARSPQTVPSAMTARQQKAVESLRSTMGVAFGGLHAAGDGVWFASASDRSCLLVENGEGIGASCATTPATEAGRLAFNASSTTSDVAEFVGVVPDGVETVTAKNAAGASVATDVVSSNIYRVKGRGITKLTLTGQSSRSDVVVAG